MFNAIANLANSEYQRWWDTYWDREHRLDYEDFTQKMFDKNVQLDNTKVQRLVADAQKAGINPLAAMGMQPYSGQSTGAFTNYAHSGTGGTISGLDNYLLNKKQRQLINEKLQAEIDYQNALTNSLENKDNDEIGAGDVGEVRVIPSQKESSGYVPGQSAAINPAGAGYRAGNKIVTGPSEKFAESTEDYFPAKVEFFFVDSFERAKFNRAYRTGIGAADVRQRKMQYVKDLTNSGEIQRNEDLRWDTLSGRFVIVKMRHPHDRQLWYKPRIHKKRSMKYRTDRRSKGAMRRHMMNMGEIGF